MVVHLVVHVIAHAIAYRVVCEVKDNELIIVAVIIGHRSEVYDRN